MFNKIDRQGPAPVIGVSACRELIGPHWFHAAGEKYLAAVADGAGAIPLLIPAAGNSLDRETLLARLDGILLTGSLSNVEPRHYGGPASAAGTHHDPERDETTLPLILAAVKSQVPLLAVCRGFQECNVAFGGTLHQRVHEQPGFADHREAKDQPLEIKYGPAHKVTLVAGGTLHRLAGTERVEVNSLHAQGVDRLADGLVVEATADDGLIEGFRVQGAGTLALAVQWHPEWRYEENALSRALFAALGDASRERAAQRSS